MNQQNLIDLKITTGPYSDFIQHTVSLAREGRSAYVCFANAHMFSIVSRDEAYKNVINQAQLVAADGKPLTWALNLLYGIKQERIAGMDFLPSMLDACQANDLPVYFYGGSPTLIENAIARALIKYPTLKIAGAYSPPFRPLTSEETDSIIHAINQTSPSVIFVALGCPKQERWMFEMHDRLSATMVGIGGALSVFAGVQRRAPLWMQKNGLEWLFRFMQEPFRLFKRYMTTNTYFIRAVTKEFFRLRLSRRKKELKQA